MSRNLPMGHDPLWMAARACVVGPNVGECVVGPKVGESNTLIRACTAARVGEAVGALNASAVRVCVCVECALWLWLMGPLSMRGRGRGRSTNALPSG